MSALHSEVSPTLSWVSPLSLRNNFLVSCGSDEHPSGGHQSPVVDPPKSKLDQIIVNISCHHEII